MCSLCGLSSPLCSGFTWTWCAVVSKLTCCCLPAAAVLSFSDHTLLFLALRGPCIPLTLYSMFITCISLALPSLPVLLVLFRGSSLYPTSPPSCSALADRLVPMATSTASTPGVRTHFKTPEGRYNLSRDKTHPSAIPHYSLAAKVITQVSSSSSPIPPPRLLPLPFACSTLLAFRAVNFSNSTSPLPCSCLVNFLFF